MKKHYQYIIFLLILIIIYELYLIFSFKYKDIEKDSIITKTQVEIEQYKQNIQERRNYFNYVNTSAYKDQIAKSSQNKKNN
jgi:ABC-type maltose transport system permease subunit